MGCGRPDGSAASSPSTVSSLPAPSPAIVQNPQERSGAGLFNDASGRLLLVGGFGRSGSPLSDVWAWSGTGWTRVADQTALGGRSFLTGVFDPAHGVTLVWDAMTGQTWALASATVSGVWNGLYPTTAPPKTGGILVYDAGHHRPMLLKPAAPWAWDGSNWTQLPATATPSPRDYFAAAYDPASGQAVLFGGVGAPGSGLEYSDTWIYQGSDWAQFHPAHTPPAGVAYAAFDGSTGHILLVAKDRSTWSWTGTDWQLVVAAHRPSGSPVRLFAAIGYSPSTRQVVLFGGKYDDPPLQGAPTSDTFIWDGNDWSLVANRN